MDRKDMERFETAKASKKNGPEIGNLGGLCTWAAVTRSFN